MCTLAHRNFYLMKYFTYLIPDYIHGSSWKWSPVGYICRSNTAKQRFLRKWVHYTLLSKCVKAFPWSIRTQYADMTHVIYFPIHCNLLVKCSAEYFEVEWWVCGSGLWDYELTDTLYCTVKLQSLPLIHYNYMAKTWGRKCYNSRMDVGVCM